MIVALAAQGKRVGVTATSHKVIRNLLDAVSREAAAQGQEIRLGHKVADASETLVDGSWSSTKNDDAYQAVATSRLTCLAGPRGSGPGRSSQKSVDVLFIDEAGQMSLANALAVSQATATLVLLGDPQQLEQPQKGSHPDGVDASALDHVLEGHKTMPADRGLFLPVTWRLSPAICAFTSEVFYEASCDRSRARAPATRRRGPLQRLRPLRRRRRARRVPQLVRRGSRGRRGHRRNCCSRPVSGGSTSRRGEATRYSAISWSLRRTTRR